MERKHEDYFTKKIFRKQFVPAIISACGLAFGDMMDGIVVGQRMGVTGLAAISLALPSFMVMNVLMHGLGLGGAIRFSGLMAKGKKEEGIRGFQGILSAALIISALLSIGANLFMTPLLALLGTTEADGALFAVSRTYLQIILSGMPLFFTAYVMNYFLRNDDSEKLAGFGFTVGNLSDIVLNVVFVLLLDGGAAGAAWATLAGQLISICVYLPGFSGKTHSLRLLPFCPDSKGSLSCFKAGFASSSQYLFSMVFLLCANRVLLRSMGSVGVAVFDVVQNVSFLIIYLYDGAVKAAQPLLSTYCGEHNRPGRRCTMRLALSRGLTAGGMVALVTDYGFESFKDRSICAACLLCECPFGGSMYFAGRLLPGMRGREESLPDYDPAGSGSAASGYAAFFCMGREVLLVAVSGDGGAYPSYFRRILQIHCGEAGGI